MKKTVHTVPNPDGKGWVNKYGGKEVSHHHRKDTAVEQGREIAIDHHTEHNIHNTDGYYRSLCIQMNQYGRSWEPEGIERETSHVIGCILGDPKNTAVTKGDMARALAITIEEIDSLIFGLGGMVSLSGKYAFDADAQRKRGQLKKV